MTRKAHFTSDAVERVRALAERELPHDEFIAWADGPISDEEMAENIALIQWFTRRYPTPAERLRSARRRQVQLARTTAYVRRSG
jgi:hypothetical protein